MKTLRLLAVPLLIACIMRAQSRPSINQADLTVIQADKLDMDTVTRFYQASGDLQALTIRDQAARNALGQEIGTLDSFASRIQSSADLSAVVQHHGFTPHTFAVTELAVLQAMFALGDRQTGTKDAALTKANINIGNVDFFQQHAQEIATIRRRYVH